MTLDKIQHIVKFIEENYQRNILPEELEDIACYSYRNVHRIFKNIFQETLGEFQKRLKLENAYKKLIYTNDSITDIAFAVGFESLQAFTKSFTKQFAISPSISRKNKLAIFEDYIQVANKKESIAYETVYLSAMKIYYKSIKTSNYDNDEIDKLWDFIDATYGQEKNCQYYGIIVDEPLITLGKHCRYEAAINQDPTDKSFASKTIFGGRYAKFLHRGSYDTIEDTYRLIYKSWLFETELELDHSPIIEYYEKHQFDAEQENNFLTQILIPLKKK